MNWQNYSNDEVTRWVTCLSKRYYHRPGEVSRAAHVLSRQFQVRYTYYACPYCHGFHLTSQVDGVHDKEILQ
jgi:hypothetical protein